MTEKLMGTWTSVSSKQAKWKTVSSHQCQGKTRGSYWGKNHLKRPVEVLFLQSKGKVLVDAPKNDDDEVLEALLRALKKFMELDEPE